MNFEFLHPADQIVLILKRIYDFKLTTTSGGNLSIRDENGDIWITPSGVDKGNLKREDIIRVSPDGKIFGKHKPSVELPFHQQIYHVRPDIKAIIHAHPPSIMSYSLVHSLPKTDLIPDMHIMCKPVCIVEYELPGSKMLGEKIANAFKSGHNLAILENHGVVVGHCDMFKAFELFEMLNYCCELNIRANMIKEPKSLSEEDINLFHSNEDIEMNEFKPCSFSSYEKQLRKGICELSYRAYHQGLFTSAFGAISHRIGNNSFVITPADCNKDYLEPEDLVRVENRLKEDGKKPDKTVFLHRYIYEKHHDIDSIIVARPTNIMAFAVTDMQFNSRTVPETYIVLRDVKKVPFGYTSTRLEEFGPSFDITSPALIEENNYVVIVGKSLMDVFDKLEVLEFTARALIDALRLGDIKTIDQAQIDRIKEAFLL